MPHLDTQQVIIPETKRSQVLATSFCPSKDNAEFDPELEEADLVSEIFPTGLDLDNAAFDPELETIFLLAEIVPPVGLDFKSLVITELMTLYFPP